MPRDAIWAGTLSGHGPHRLGNNLRPCCIIWSLALAALGNQAANQASLSLHQPGRQERPLRLWDARQVASRLGAGPSLWNVPGRQPRLFETETDMAVSGWANVAPHDSLRKQQDPCNGCPPPGICVSSALQSPGTQQHPTEGHAHLKPRQWFCDHPHQFLQISTCLH